MKYVVKRRKLPDDELMHFKYIKKIKKDGKWKYYYPGDLSEDIMNELGAKDKREYQLAVGRLHNIEADKKDHKRRWEDNQRIISIANKYGDKSLLKSAKRSQKDLENKSWHLVSREKRARDAIKSTKAKYYKTPLGKLDKTIDRGRKWLGRLFD